MQETAKKIQFKNNGFNERSLEALSEEFFEFKPEFSMAKNPLKEPVEKLEIIPKTATAGDQLFIALTQYAQSKNATEKRINGDRVPLPELIKGHIILSKNFVNSLDITHPVLNDVSNIGHNYAQAMIADRRKKLNLLVLQ